MKARQRRLLAVLLGLGALGLATALVLRALGDNVMFFFSPTQIAAAQAPRDAAFRLGGLVEPASLHRDAGDSLTVRFVVTDQVHRVPVRYRGVLPDLFKEGKGVVVAGRLREDGAFVATQVLAKHDENYMPPEAAAALDHARQAGATGGARHAGGVAADSPALVPGAAP